MTGDYLNFRQNAGVQLGRSGKPKGSVKQQFPLNGQFKIEHYRNGLLLAKYSAPNAVVDEGVNKLFGIGFNAATQITTWYMLLIDNAGFSALDNGDTYDDIDQAGNGWDEFTDYTDPGNGDSTVTRPVWDEAAPSGRAITNSTQTVYDIVATGTVKGLGLVGGGAASNTKGDHASDGTLFNTALFDQGDTGVVNGDQLKVTYTLSA